MKNDALQNVLFVYVSYKCFVFVSVHRTHVYAPLYFSTCLVERYAMRFDLIFSFEKINLVVVVGWRRSEKSGIYLFTNIAHCRNCVRTTFWDWNWSIWLSVSEERKRKSHTHTHTHDFLCAFTNWNLMPELNKILQANAIPLACVSVSLMLYFQYTKYSVELHFRLKVDFFSRHIFGCTWIRNVWLLQFRTVWFVDFVVVGMCCFTFVMPMFDAF